MRGGLRAAPQDDRTEKPATSLQASARQATGWVFPIDNPWREAVEFRRGLGEFGETIVKSVGKFVLFALLLLVTPAAVLAYDYPIADPFMATVVGTPEEMRADIPTGVPFRRRSIEILDREVPEVFFYDKKLRYSYVRQRGPAPLIFMIAGTGASHDGSKNWLAAKAFWGAGYHVVALPSPVSPNFIVAANESGVPGHAFEDAARLYRVMETIWSRLEGKLEVTHFDLAGYSLGGFNAGFVAKLDQERQKFNFRRVLMMNPPVRLYSSISLLDRMLENIPGGEDNFDLFFEDLFNAFSEAYQRSDKVAFNDELLYKAFETLRPTDELLAALIGVVFRIAGANMAFTADVMTDYGYIKPRNVRLRRNTNTQTYERVSMRLGFTDYFHAFFYPYQKALDPDISRSELIEQMSLATIMDFLANSDHVFMMHNADDLILESGEIDLLYQMFGDRGKVFPTGGHMGNMEHRDYIGHMLEVMTGAGR